MIEEILNEIAAQCGTGLEKVEAFIYSYANVMTINFGRCVMRLDEGDLSSDALAEVRSYKRKIDRRLRVFIQEGIADGSIAPCDAKIAAFAIAGAVNWICQWYEPEGSLSAEEIATQFARTLTRGLARIRKPGRVTPAWSHEVSITGVSATSASSLISKAAVLGAGTMGSRIAAHLANAGIPVVLLDIPSPSGPRGAVAAAALEALKKSRPAAFYEPSAAARISTGNFDDDLALLAGCDWVIEAITENLEIKQTLLNRVAPHLKPDAILSTNTSGLPVGLIAAGLPDRCGGGGSERTSSTRRGTCGWWR